MAGRIGLIPKNSRSRYMRRDLLKQFQPLPAQTVFEHHESGGVAAWPRQAADYAGAHRIGDAREYDWHRVRVLLDCRYAWRASGKNDVRRQRNQFLCVFASRVGVACVPAIIDPHVPADAPTQFRQPLRERSDEGSRLRIIRSRVHQHADAPHPFGLLRAHGERPCGCRAAKQRDELAALNLRAHSITSSARARKDSGIVRPIAFADLTLTTSSNLVGC
jgi:hypothetical protein